MDDERLPATVHDVPTPSFLVDIDIVRKNAQTMIDRCKAFGVDLRPHMKTHKTVEAGVIMTGGTRKKISVSTIEEARFFASHGFEDILYAFPVTEDKMERCRVLANQLQQFHMLLESRHSLDCLLKFPLPSGKKWSVFIEVDTGFERTGFRWDGEEVVQVAREVSQCPGVTFQGLYVHCGNSYSAGGDVTKIHQVAEETTDRLLALKKRLQEAGVECKVVGTGSTPTCSKPTENMATLTEFHPGNYIFYDYWQCLIGSCTLDDVACRVATRVVSHKPSVDQLVVDCGALGLSLDGVAADLPTGCCVVQGHPDLKHVGMSQELGKFRPKEGKMDFSKYPIGTILFLYPYHSCITAAGHPRYFIYSGEKIVGVWKPAKFW